MGKGLDDLTAEERAALDEGWEELGKSIAQAVVEGGKSLVWAWSLLGPLGMYKRWMPKLWVERYRQENPQAGKKRAKRPGRPRTTTASTFSKREQINLALKLLSQGQDPLEYFKTKTNSQPNGRNP